MNPHASPGPATDRPSSSALPDYYADERRARRRARLRQTLGWVSVDAGLAGLAGAVYFLDSGR